jgi:hypothetical protein
VFSSSPHTEFEENEVEILDQESSILRFQSLYDSLQQESSALEESIEKMCVMRDVLERDQMQVNQELLAIEKDQLGPPRRLALNHEMSSIDTWKQRSAQIRKRLEDLQYTVDKAHDRKRTADAQCLDLAQKLAILREERRKAQEAKDAESSLGALPIVIGRSLSKVPGMGDQFAKPKEAYDAITHQSRLVDMKAQGETVIQIHKERSAFDQQLWVNRQDGQENVYEYESLLSRLAQVAERLSKASVSNARENLVDGLKGFFARSIKLNPLKSKLVGILPWYSHHDPLVSRNIIRYVTNNAMGAITFDASPSEGDSTSREASEEDPPPAGSANNSSNSNSSSYSTGVTLGQEKTGFCAGIINLPKESLWSVLITVTKQGSGEAFTSTDPSDCVTVKIGPTYSGLSVVGTFFNLVNPSTGTVLYDVKHVFKGSSFAFRFDFSSSTSDPRKHLAVCTGIYEEYEMPEVEVIEDVYSGKTRVLSSFVKLRRIDEQTGKYKDTKLLEELVNIESATTAHWDSDILNNYSQRYSKEYFLRILRAEILIHQDIAAAAASAAAKKKDKDAFETRAIMAGANLDKEAKLEVSMKRYITKKRLAQVPSWSRHLSLLVS